MGVSSRSVQEVQRRDQSGKFELAQARRGPDGPRPPELAVVAVDTVVGIVDDPDAAASAVDELVTSGIPEERIQVLCGESGARRLDPSGERHGVLGRLQRERVASILRENGALRFQPTEALRADG